MGDTGPVYDVVGCVKPDLSVYFVCGCESVGDNVHEPIVARCEPIPVLLSAFWVWSEAVGDDVHKTKSLCVAVSV